MEAIVKHSILNPFASCFIPSSLKKFQYENFSTEIKNKEVKQKEATAASSNIIESDDQNKEPDTLQCPPSGNKDLVIATEVSNVNENADHKVTAFDTREDKNVWNKTDIMAFLELLLLILYTLYSHKNFSVTHDTDDSSEKKSDSLKKSKCDDECNCPPIFGYVIPPNFFGNPFNLNYGCKKNIIHASYFSPDPIKEKVSKSMQDGNYDETLNIESKTTLEQYSLELAEIVKDVCETISSSTDDCIDRQTDNGENQNLNEHGRKSSFSSTSSEDIYTEAVENRLSPIGTKIPSKKSVCSTDENLMETSEDLQLNDDEDLHPLLNEDIYQTDNDEVFVGVPVTIQKMIEAGLSSKSELLLDPEKSENGTCNPPCSYWCDSIPQSARDSYRKFMKSFSDPGESSWKSVTDEDSLKQKLLFRKPLYKRSFSANDCVKRNCETGFRIESSFDAESRERLLLLRRDPISYFKLDFSSHALKSRSNSFSSALKEDSSYCRVNENQSDLFKKDQSSMWGPFDGADSLWQPLPDCVPTNENHCKLNYRKVREMKRQRSVN